MSDDMTIYHVKNKTTGIVHTVAAGHWSLTNENYEIIEPPRKRGGSTKDKKNGT